MRFNVRIILHYNQLNFLVQNIASMQYIADKIITRVLSVQECWAIKIMSKPTRYSLSVNISLIQL